MKNILKDLEKDLEKSYLRWEKKNEETEHKLCYDVVEYSNL